MAEPEVPEPAPLPDARQSIDEDDIATVRQVLAGDWLTTGPEMIRVDPGEPWQYEIAEVGLNYRASDLHCALGLSQLGKLKRFTARRADLVARYDRRLAPLAPVLRPLGPDGGAQGPRHRQPGALYPAAPTTLLS